MAPFNEVRLSPSEGVAVEDCAWNPAAANLVALCLSDGSLVSIELKDRDVEINSLPPATAAKYSIVTIVFR